MHAPKQNALRVSADTLTSTHKPISSHRSHCKAIPTSKIIQGVVIKTLLPMLVAVLARIGIKTPSASSAGHWLIKCLFHKGCQERNASLSMHSGDMQHLSITSGSATYAQVVDLRPVAGRRVVIWAGTVEIRHD